MKTNLTPQNRELCELYAKVRKIRESKSGAQKVAADLEQIHQELEAHHTQDWLLRYELLELNRSLKLNAPWEKSIMNRFKEISAKSADHAELISRGMTVLK